MCKYVKSCQTVRIAAQKEETRKERQKLFLAFKSLVHRDILNYAV